jgi:glutamate synthase (NADPH/NADH) small chain
MGKPTGFLEYARRDDLRRPPEERVRDWEEFHIPLPQAVREQQGARCMNCGVPFCQTGMVYEGRTFGCPLHNLIPEWNDMIMSGNLGHALARLLKTNNFPEFTGRVCPAPCESACVCGIYGEAVANRDNELSIIEGAFSAGLMRRRRPPQWSGKKVCVVGSGPAGLAAADQLNHRGHSVTVVEREAHPGGLLTYGIPSMKLDKSIVKRRLDLMTDEGVTFVTGVDAADEAVARRLLAEYDAVILGCGAGRPRPRGWTPRLPPAFTRHGVSQRRRGAAGVRADPRRAHCGGPPCGDRGPRRHRRATAWPPTAPGLRLRTQLGGAGGRTIWWTGHCPWTRHEEAAAVNRRRPPALCRPGKGVDGG